MTCTLFPNVVDVCGSFPSRIGRKICVLQRDGQRIVFAVVQKHEVALLTYDTEKRCLLPSPLENDSTQISVLENENYASLITDVDRGPDKDVFYHVDRKGHLYLNRRNDSFIYQTSDKFLRKGHDTLSPRTSTFCFGTKVNNHLPPGHYGISVGENAIASAHSLSHELRLHSLEGTHTRSITLDGYPTSLFATKTCSNVVVTATGSELVLFDIRQRTSAARCNQIRDNSRARCGNETFLSICDAPSCNFYAVGNSRTLTCLDVRKMQARHNCRGISKYDTCFVHWDAESISMKVYKTPSDLEGVSSAELVVTAGTDSEANVRHLPSGDVIRTVHGDDMWMGPPSISDAFLMGVTLRGSLVCCDILQ